MKAWLVLTLGLLTHTSAAVAQNDGREATSLLGRPLLRAEPAAENRARLEKELADARAAYERSPDDADAIIWLGRRTAYLNRFREAIEIFSEGIRKHPNDARLYRHRGHRYITVREFDNAIRDLERAAALERGKADEIEPDGAPNRFNIPIGTLQSNIWYHLALAHYLKHDFEKALTAWLESMKLATNDDRLVSSGDWLYMTYRRLGREQEAARVLERIRPDMRILENEAYHKRLLMYKGLVKPDDVLAFDNPDPVQIATYGYGVANWYLYSGQPDKARELFRRILEGKSWSAFGFIAAESELAAAK
ncbi:MAG: tetratricopeptide repeat protein [Longimicrobiales bacterium]